jgi:hypothetical protein
MDPENVKHMWDFSTATAGALVGTAVGAGMAFWLERRKRQQEMQDQNVAAANLAIFQLARAYDYLFQYQREVIDPHRGQRLAWLHMARKEMRPGDAVRIDPGTLGFLFTSSDSDAPSLVAVELDRFETIWRMNDRIKDLVTREARPQMEQMRVPEGASAEQIEQAIGVRVHRALTSLTASIIEHVDKNLPSILATARRVHLAAAALYPGRRVITFFPKGAGQDDNPK